MVGWQDAGDVTQQVFLQVFRSIGQFSGQSRFETWLYRLAVNESLQHLRRNRMSRKDLMDEMKDSEGDPHVKQQRRQRGQEIATNRMLQDVAKADVVVVNPTHYAVAVSYKHGDMPAPKLSGDRRVLLTGVGRDPGLAGRRSRGAVVRRELDVPAAGESLREAGQRRRARSLEREDVGVGVPRHDQVGRAESAQDRLGGERRALVVVDQHVVERRVARGGAHRRPLQPRGASAERPSR